MLKPSLLLCPYRALFLDIVKFRVSKAEHLSRRRAEVCQMYNRVTTEMRARLLSKVVSFHLASSTAWILITRIKHM